MSDSRGRTAVVKNLWLKLGLTSAVVILYATLYFSGAECLFKAVMGVICPGCGMSRACISALRFDFASAFSYHPMFWSLPIVYLYILFDGKLFKGKLANILPITLIGVGFIASYVYRLIILY